MRRFANRLLVVGVNLVKNVAIERFDAEHPLFTTFGDSEITLAVSESPISPDPEPSALVLLVSGAAGILAHRRRRASGASLAISGG